MDGAPPSETAPHEILPELLLAELDDLAAALRLDLAVAAELQDGRLDVRSASGPLAGHLPSGRSVALAECPAERAAVEGARVELAPGGVDPLLGFTLAEPAARAVLPVAVHGRCKGTLTLVRAGAGPFDASELDRAAVHARVLGMALHAASLSEEVERMKSHGEERVSLLEIELRGPGGGAIEASKSPRMQEIAWRARQVAPTDTPVLILGETGAGKEWLAHAIHGWSARTRAPFVKMNCAAIAAGTLDSELFGHDKGAFTGATRSRPGRFQIADGGTLLLDEIGELPLDVQAKLLRVLQDGTFFPVGSDRLAHVNVRVLAATHVDLLRAIAERRFRDDLFYRLNVFPLTLPPLRERLEDLPMLCEVLLAQQSARTGRSHVAVTPAGLEKLASHTWPGNLRELGNVLERATILSRSAALGPDVLDLPHGPSLSASPPVEPPAAAAPAAQAGDAATLDDLQRAHIERVLRQTKGRVYGEGGAARILGLKPSTLQGRMRKLGLRRPTDGGDV